MLEVTAGNLRIVPDHQYVFAVISGGRLAVIETARFDIFCICHNVFVVMDPVAGNRSQRNACIDHQIHGRFAGFGTVAFLIDDNFYIHTPFFGGQKPFHDDR